MFKFDPLQRSNKYGQYTKLCGMHHGEAWLTIGPNRILFAIAILLINVISLYLLLLLYPFESAYSFFIMHVVIIIYLDIAWVATALINPGLKTLIAQGEYPCPLCENPNLEDINVTNYQHCHECQICIEDRDHHCPLTGGCIGSGNRIAYYFYLLGMFLWVIDVVSTAPFAYYLL